MAIAMRIAGASERPMPKRVNLTNRAVEDAGCPVGKSRVWLHDTKQPGLVVAIRSTGASVSKVFYINRRIKGGKPQQHRLGAFPEIKVDDARQLARKALLDIANHKDLNAEKKAARAKSMTVGQLWTWFLDDWAKPRKRSWKADETRYNCHIAPWAKRQLVDITSADVSALHNRVAKATTETTANRCLALLSTMFNKARTIGWNRPNPCAGVAKFSEQSRERFLSPVEMQRFFDAIESEPDPAWKDFFQLALFTGARRSNVLSMRWDELNLESGQWSIPGAKFKNKQPVVLHLTPQAVAIIKARQGNGSQWVFPSGRYAVGHLMKPERAWAALCQRAELDDLRIHDLRRSLGSWLAAANVSPTIIGKVLGHRSIQATAIYSRLNIESLRSPVDAAVLAMTTTKSESRFTDQPMMVADKPDYDSPDYWEGFKHAKTGKPRTMNPTAQYHRGFADATAEKR